MKYLFPVVFLFILCSCGENKKASIGAIDIDSLLVLYPDSVDLLVERGNRYLKTFEFDKAIADGAKAFRIDSNNLEARLLFADILNNKPDRSITTDVSAAQRHYKFALKKRPKDPKVLISLASTYSQQMDFEESFKLINKALRIDKRYRDAYVLKGSNYLFLNKPDLAKSSYETAVQQDPNFFEAYLMLGSLYQSENNEICLEYYRTAVSLQPKNPDVLFSLAYAYQLFNQPAKALALYRKMIQVDTAYYQALNQIGVIKQYNYKEIDSAIYFYKSALQTEPRFVQAWHNLGMCYEERGDVSQALQSYGKALKYDPNFEMSRERADQLKNAR
ncbi:MAG: tetratricopeptide repeat protein [Flavobacteriia bacterium]